MSRKFVVVMSEILKKNKQALRRYIFPITKMRRRDVQNLFFSQLYIWSFYYRKKKMKSVFLETFNCIETDSEMWN